MFLVMCGTNPFLSIVIFQIGVNLFSYDDRFCVLMMEGANGARQSFLFHLARRL